MSQQDEGNIAFSKKGRREVSPFIGHELLYDFVNGGLDPERSSAVADHVKFSRDAQLDLEKIQNGQSYATKLSQTVVSQTVMEKINSPSNYITVLLQKTQFEKWPQGVKWGLEALFVVAAMVLVLTLTPWQKVFDWSQGLSSKELILSEVPKVQTSTISEEKPDFVDEELQAPQAEVKAIKGTEVTKETKPIKPTPTASPHQQVASTPAPAPAATASSTAVTGDPSKPTAAAASTGYLYRAQFAVANLDVTGPKISEQIASLGGRKAGSVELGWKKTPTSMYYHFTIPENRYQEFITFLQTYGPVTFSKEKHPRVMPDGILRVIFTIDESAQ